MKSSYSILLLLPILILSGCGFFKIIQGECESLRTMVSAPFKHVTVMTWNVHRGQGSDGTNDLARVAAVIKKANPHFVALQEVDRSTPRSGGVDQLEELARQTGLQPIWAKTENLAQGETGVALLVREEPLNVDILPLPGSTSTVLLVAEFTECLVGVTQLSLDPEARRAAVSVLRRPVNPVKPFFLAGDFRETASGETIRALRNAFAIVSGQAPTYPAGAPQKCHDFVLLSRRHYARFEHTKAEVIPNATASTHRPVVVTLR